MSPLKSPEEKHKTGKKRILSETILIAIILIITFNFSGFLEFISRIIGLLTPLFIGGILAFLSAPIFNVIRDFFRNRVFHKLKKPERPAKVIASTVIVLLILAVIAGCVMLVIPSFISSLTNVVNNISSGDTELTVLLQRLFSDKPAVNEEVVTTYNSISAWIVDFIQNNVLPALSNLYLDFGTQLFEIAKGLLNILVGIIVTVYVLNMKERLVRSLKRIIKAFTRTEVMEERILNECRFINRTFYGFFFGKIIDSLIIGVICLVVTKIMGIPYATLVSVIVGITNIIPFWGPFIGGIIGGVLIVLVSPIHAVYFAVWILILQQLDGNIIGPKILGDATGISSLEVLVAILLFGGLFGFAGMLIGVPLWAVLVDIIKKFIGFLIRKKQENLAAEEPETENEE